MGKTDKYGPVDYALDDLACIKKAFCAYREDLGSWPRPGHPGSSAGNSYCAYLGGFQCLFGEQPDVKGWHGPYLRDYSAETGLTFPEGILLDPWGKGYQVYRFPPHFSNGQTKGSITAVSCGPNGILDTPTPGIAFGYPSGDDLITVIDR